MGGKYIYYRKLSFKSDIKSLEKFLNISERIFKSFSKSKKSLYKYIISLDEIFTNCIIHGYKNRQGVIEVEYKVYKNWIITDISDNGVGIRKELTGSLEFLKENKYRKIKEKIGYGLTITSYLADKVIVGKKIDGGTKVSLYFIIK
ncbi:ATP-binding protein [Anaerobranca gottschalkii]|uniref:Histidine kinase-like ATPase domain-containing protein n=1 Tax=Anaerobranca gottschalkii DSM 13577 TaxID=1120990 RepID=A0A1I0AU32_9FIRM|nr:ATP-binding protein [Anaerobranca gottschalkii]SES97450.1 Histidine kinase-like ATPase domain-containing protein [Anaerobranca gottschalkii DSM 13577]